MAGKKSDFDGDGKAEILIASPWGIGILKLAGNTLTVPMMAPNGTRFGGHGDYPEGCSRPSGP